MSEPEKTPVLPVHEALDHLMAAVRGALENDNLTGPHTNALVDALTDAIATVEEGNGLNCPNCGGNGTIEVMSDGGPDAYPVQVTCEHCHGRTTLDSAYEGVFELLRQEQDRSRRISAITWRFGRGEGSAITRLHELAKTLDEHGNLHSGWVAERLRELGDSLRIANERQELPEPAYTLRWQQERHAYSVRIHGAQVVFDDDVPAFSAEQVRGLLAEQEKKARTIEPAGWRDALEFYAGQMHFNLVNTDAWDTVSGEPTNFWCDEAGTATMEDGTVAAMALANTPLPDDIPTGWRGFLTELVEACERGDISEDSEQQDWAHIMRTAKRMLKTPERS